MKTLLRVILCGFLLLPQSGTALHFVFDLDDTIIEAVETGPRSAEIVNIAFETELGTANQAYRVPNDVRALISKLISEGHKISIFSAGLKPRNEAVLREIYVFKNGKHVPLLDVVEKLRSKEDLSVDGKILGQPYPISHFNGGKVKDLLKIVDKKEFNQTFLVEDQLQYAGASQYKNVIFRYFLQSSFDLQSVGAIISEIEKQKSKKRVIKYFSKLHRHENEIFRLAGVIENIINLERKKGPLLDAAFEFQFNSSKMDTLIAGHILQNDIYEQGFCFIKDFLAAANFPVRVPEESIVRLEQSGINFSDTERKALQKGLPNLAEN